MQELKKHLESDLKTQYISSSILLDTLSVINEDSRKSSSYVDPNYIPFYYYLGKYLKPKSLAEIGTGLAFFSTNFMKSCKTVENLFLFQEKNKEFYSPRFAIRNVKSVFRKKVDYFYGKIEDATLNNYDLILLNEEKTYDRHLLTMELMWQHLNLDGYFVVDYVNSNEISNQSFVNFCKIKNRTPIYIKTRYGVGIIQK